MKKVMPKPVFLAGFLIIFPILSIPAFALSGAPSKPIAPSSYSGSTTLTFQWNEGTLCDIESWAWFHLEVSVDSSTFTSPLTDTVQWNHKWGSTWTYDGTVGGCQSGQIYYARVRADDGQGQYSDWSPVSNPVTIDLTPPSGNPTQPSDEGVYSTTTTLKFEWLQGSVTDYESGLSGIYHLQVGTHTDLSQQQDGWKFDGNLSTTSYTVYNCLHGCIYYARVSAYNNAGLESDFSNQSDGITVDTTTPSIPGQVSPSSHYYSSSTSITFEWNAGAGDPESGIDYYQVQVGTATSEPEIFGVLNTTTNATFTTINNCEQAKTYYARVRSKNGAGVYGNWLGPDSNYSITIDTTPPDGAPSKPQGIYYAFLNYIKFTWSIGASTDDISGIKDYWLQVDDSTTFAQGVMNFTGIGATEKWVTVPQTGVTYYARVCARNGALLYGNFSQTSDGVFADATPPENFELFLPELVWNEGTGCYYSTSTSVIVSSWTASQDPQSGIQHYAIAVGNSADQHEDNVLGWTIIGSSVTKSTTTEGLSLQNGNTYYYKVDAVNGAGSTTTVVSDPIIVDYTNPFPPAWVYDGSASDVDYSSSTDVFAANWASGYDPESNIKDYYYVIGSTPGANDVVSWSTAPLTSITKSVTLSHNNTYYITVWSGNYAGLTSTASCSSDGVLIDTSPPQGKPSVPTDEGEYSSSTDLLFSWGIGIAHDDESGIWGYRLQVGTSTSPSFVANHLDTQVTDSSIQVSGCSSGKTYFARVAAVNNAGSTSNDWSDISDGILVDTFTPTIAWVRDGPDPAVDITYQSSSTTYHGNWSAATNIPCGTSYYSCALGTTPGGTDKKPWTIFSATTTYACFTGLSLKHAIEGYYFTVKVISNSGKENQKSSDGFIVDITSPIGGPGTPVPDSTYSNSDKIAFSWTGGGTDPESGIAGYFFEVGTSSESFVADFYAENVGDNLSITLSNAQDGKTYFARVSAINGAGLHSNPSGISKGITVDTTAPAVPTVRISISGDVVTVTGKAEAGSSLAAVTIIDQNDKEIDIGLLDNFSIDSAGNFTGTFKISDILNKYPLITRFRASVIVSDPAGNRSQAGLSETIATPVSEDKLTCYNNLITAERKTAFVRYDVVDAGHVTIRIYNIAGEFIKKLLDSEVPADSSGTVEWDGKNYADKDVASGTYFVHIHTPKWQDTKKIIVVR